MVDSQLCGNQECARFTLCDGTSRSRYLLRYYSISSNFQDNRDWKYSIEDGSHISLMQV